MAPQNHGDEPRRSRGLPTEHDHATRRIRTKSRCDERTGQPHVLLAEDDAEFCSLVERALESAGYRVTICPDGVALADHIGSYVLSGATHDFDLIVSDIRMPGVSALQILEAMSNWAGFPPMILMTAFGDEATHAAAERLGAAATLDKPFELDALLTIARDLIGRRRRRVHETGHDDWRTDDVSRRGRDRGV